MARALFDPELAAQMRFLAGPTGAGKSAIAVELAVRLDAEIIGVDAFQIYRGLDLLTAKPSPALRARVPHHLVDCLPLEAALDAVRFVKMAQAAARDILRRGKVPLAVGGTGLYFHALQHGLDEMPASEPALRAELNALPLAALQAEYAARDPVGALRIDWQNPRRLVRAVEVCRLAGRPYSSFRRDWNQAEPESPPARQAIFLEREKTDLYARINARVEQMFGAGVLAEVQALPPEMPTARQTLGLREVQAVAGGAMSERAAIAAIQQATRRYAKRQLTWFRRQPEFTWIRVEAEPSPAEIAARLAAFFHEATAL